MRRSGEHRFAFSPRFVASSIERVYEQIYNKLCLNCKLSTLTLRVLILGSKEFPALDGRTGQGGQQLGGGEGQPYAGQTEEEAEAEGQHHDPHKAPEKERREEGRGRSVAPR